MGKEKSKSLTIVGGDKSSARIKYSGVYDLQGLISESQAHLRDLGYHILLNAQEEKGDGGKQEFKLEFTATRKITEYIKFTIKVVIEVKNGSNVIAEEGGKKQTFQRGDIEVLLRATMDKNYKTSFKTELLRQTYEKYIMKAELERYEGKLENEAKDLMDIMKSYVPAYRR